MRKVLNKQKLSYYISKYKIDEIFSTDMSPHMELFQYAKNEFICKTEEELDYLLFFVEGKAKVYSTLSNGKSLLLCFYKPFKVLGDVELLNLNRASTNVQVIEEAFCIGISFEDIRRYSYDDSGFLRYICENLGSKLIRISKYSSINLLYPLESRLASYILANTSNIIHNGKSIIAFEGNLSEVSELLGTSYRHLLRTLNDLCEKKAFRKDIHSYEILDIAQLQRLAGDLYE